MLNDSNLKSCQENLLIVLAIMDFNVVLRANSPLPLNNSNSQIAYVCDHEEGHFGSDQGLNI